MQKERGPTRVPSAAAQIRADQNRATVGGASGTAGVAPYSAPGLDELGNSSTHGATSPRHPREEEGQRLEDKRHGAARRHEPWAEGSVVQRGFGNNYDEERRRDETSGQPRPHSEGANGFRKEDTGSASEGGKRRVPAETATSSNTSVPQRVRGAAGTVFSHQQQQERNGQPRVGSAPSAQSQGDPQHYQNSSKLSGGDAGRKISSSPPRGETERGGRGDVYSRDVSSASFDRVGNSRGISSPDRSPAPRTLDGSLDKGGVKRSPSRGGGDRGFDQQAVVRRGQYGPGRGETGTGAPTSSVAATEGRRCGGGQDGGFKAARGNEPASTRAAGDEQSFHTDGVGFSEQNKERSNAPSVGRGAARASAAANAPSAGRSGQQQRQGDKNKGGEVDSSNNGKLKGNGGGDDGGGGFGGDANGRSVPSRSGSPSPQGATTTTTTTTPTTTTLKSVQDRPKIQHMPKNMSEVAIAAAGSAGDTSPERTTGVSDTEREPHKGALVAGAAEAREGDGKGGATEAGKGMSDRQERALRAFLKGVRLFPVRRQICHRLKLVGTPRF